MNVSSPSHSNLDTGKDPERNSASRYALQVALQTMKERCQKLQNRLSRLEEENLQLRIEKKKLYTAATANKNDNFVSISALEKKVAELSRQKSQLSHHILMVATENKELWQRLSKLTEENESLGNHLNNISDTLKKQPGRSLKPDKSINLVDSCSKSKDGKEESLEEISLKVISSIMKGKTMLENQCEEMLELQDGTVSIDQCGFVLDQKDEKDNEDDSLLLEMKEILEQMSSEKEILKQQQEGLRAAVDIFQQVAADGLPCHKCTLRAKEEEANNKSKEPELKEKIKSPGNETTDRLLCEVSEPHDDTMDTVTAINNETITTPNALNDRICPLCGEFFRSSTRFTDFNDHVLSHFVHEQINPEEPDSIISNFEII